jgi:hypothetical protein
MAYAWAGTGNSGASGSGTTLTVSATYAVHDRVQVITTYGSGTTQTETVSDGTNTYTKIGATLNDAPDSQSYALYECLDAAAGTFTLQQALTVAQTFRGIAYFRQSGLANTGAGQGNIVNRASPGTAANGLTGTSITPASQPGMLMSVAYDDISSGAITAGTGFTSEGVMGNIDTAFGTSSRIEDKRITSTAATNSTFTAATGTDTYAVWSVFVPEASGSSFTSGDGNSSGTLTATGTGAAKTSVPFSSTLAAAVTGTGQSVASAAGSITVAATVTGTGAAVAAGVITETASATVTGVGASTDSGAFSSAGVATAIGVPSQGTVVSADGSIAASRRRRPESRPSSSRPPAPSPPAPRRRPPPPAARGGASTAREARRACAGAAAGMTTT